MISAEIAMLRVCSIGDCNFRGLLHWGLHVATLGYEKLGISDVDDHPTGHTNKCVSTDTKGLNHV